MATLKTVDAGNKAAGKVEIDDTILETPYHKKSVSEVTVPSEVICQMDVF